MTSILFRKVLMQTFAATITEIMRQITAMGTNEIVLNKPIYYKSELIEKVDGVAASAICHTGYIVYLKDLDIDRVLDILEAIEKNEFKILTVNEKV